MSESEFVRFLANAMELMARYSVDGPIHDVCMDWCHMGEVLTAAEDIYSEQKNLCVWNKTNTGMGAFYRSKHELVARKLVLDIYAESTNKAKPTSLAALAAGQSPFQLSAEDKANIAKHKLLKDVK